MRALEPEQRSALSRVLIDARTSRDWSRERLADEAELALRREVVRRRDCEPETILEVWESLEITRHHIDTLEGCPARPLSNPERRGRLLGVVLALRLDFDEVNRLAGGL